MILGDPNIPILVLGIGIASGIALAQGAPSQTTETRLPSTHGMEVWITQVRAARSSRGAVLFTHGAGSPSSAVWHLPSGYSVLQAVADQGFDAYGVDVRGFGGATRPSSMLSSDPHAPAAVRAAEVMPDIHAAVRFATAQSHHPRVDLVGWSWGCVVAGMYAGQHPGRVRRLILYAPVYDRKWPTRHRTHPAFRTETRALHMKWLDPKQESRGIRKAFVEKLFRFEVDPEMLLLPNGPYRDIYGPDAPVWRPDKVRAPTLLIRGTADRASLRAPVLRLFDDLLQAQHRRYVEVQGMGHFAFRTYNHAQLTGLIVNFLQAQLGRDSTSASNEAVVGEDH